jgi:hypothetical protein
MNIHEINEKISTGETLTTAEVNYYLKSLNEDINKKFGLDFNIMQCQEVSQRICFFYTTNFDEKNFKSVAFNNTDIDIYYLTHFSTFLKFKTDKGYKWFVVDPTGIQFNTDSYPMGQDKTINIKDYLNENQKALLESLKNNGYFELTSRNLIDYVNIFVDALKYNGYDISKLAIHKKLDDFCETHNITFQDDLKKKTKEIQGKSIN